MSTTEHELDRSDIDAADVDEVSEKLDDAADDDEAFEAPDGEPVTADVDLDDDPVEAAVDEIAGDSSADVSDVEAETNDDAVPYDMPEIVLASEATNDEAVAKATPDEDDDYVVPDASPDVLDELRRADIDGPLVQPAPQDDDTNAKRRPKRSADYDPAPIPIPLRVPRILGRKPRVRKVTRVVRHVDPWSVFKIAAIAHLVLYAIVMTAGVLLWNVAYATGTVENIERFFESFGWSSFEFNGGEIYHAAWIAGLFAILGLTGLAVLTSTLFNLITDLVGGVRVTVLEEEVVESRSTPMRRFVVRRPEPEVPAVIHDPSGMITREAIPDEAGELPR